jgi:hypothetical protein
MCLWVRCWDQSPVLSVGVRNNSHTEKKRAKFDRTSRSCWLLFFGCEGVDYHTFVPRGRTVNKEYCLEVLKSLREAVRKKSLIHGGGKMDASPWHCAGARIIVDLRVSRQKRNRGSATTSVLARPRPYGLVLFPKLKSMLKGRRFESIEETEGNSLTELLAI